MNCVVCHFPVSHMKKCPVCGLVQFAPMPTAGVIAALYHEDLEHFEPYIKEISVHREYFRKELGFIKKKGTLLDIGCAMGILLEEAKKIGFKVQGVDISKDAVAYCRKKGLSVSTKWPSSKFDVITAFEIIEHERDPLAMVRHIHKLLNKGGLVLITTPNYDSVWRKIMGKWWVGYRHPEHVTFWTPQSLTYLLAHTGFKNIVVRHDKPRPFPLSFAVTRSADYFPWAAWILRPLGRLLDSLTIRNPINPWDDLIVYAEK